MAEKTPIGRFGTFERSDKRPAVVIIGGGFAGLGACRHLRKHFRVILIDSKDYFEYVPSMPRAFVHPHIHGELAFTYQTVCDRMGVAFIWGEAKKVDAENKCVECTRMGCLYEVQSIEFDYLLITSGCQYTIARSHEKMASTANESLWYPSALEATVSKNTWGTLDERFLTARRMHLEDEANKIRELAEKKGTIVVIGAGPVGVEFATEVKYEYPDLNVVLCEGRDCAMSGLPERARKYCQNWMDTHGIKTIYKYSYRGNLGEGDSRLSDDTFLNEQGVYPDRVYLAVGTLQVCGFVGSDVTHPVKDGRGGEITVNKSLQVLKNDGTVWSDCIFAAGTCVKIKDFERLAGKVAPAEEMAKIACWNIELLASTRSNKKLYEIKYSGLAKMAIEFDLTSVGPRASTLVAGNRASEAGSGCLIATGLLASIFKETFIGWTKIDQCKMGWRGRCFWGIVGH